MFYSYSSRTADQIPVIDGHLALVQSAVANLNRRLKGLVFKHLRLRNRGVAIHKLPNELLARVFFFSLQEEPHPLGQLHRIAQVSANWLNLVKGTPSLFGYVTTNWTFEDAFLALRLSKNAPLDITYGGR